MGIPVGDDVTPRARHTSRAVASGSVFQSGSMRSRLGLHGLAARSVFQPVLIEDRISTWFEELKRLVPTE